jgi:hypothetical protein
MKDVDFSFEQAAKERQHPQYDPRRRTIVGPVPGTRRKSPWPVKDAGKAPPSWEVHREKNKPTRFIETRPPANMRLLEAEGRPKNLSRFKLRAIASCVLAGEHVEPGDLIECGGLSASDLIGGQRVEVLEELRPE